MLLIVANGPLKQAFVPVNKCEQNDPYLEEKGHLMKIFR